MLLKWSRRMLIWIGFVVICTEKAWYKYRNLFLVYFLFPFLFFFFFLSFFSLIYFHSRGELKEIETVAIMLCALFQTSFSSTKSLTPNFLWLGIIILPERDAADGAIYFTPYVCDLFTFVRHKGILDCPELNLSTLPLCLQI